MKVLILAALMGISLEPGIIQDVSVQNENTIVEDNSVEDVQVESSPVEEEASEHSDDVWEDAWEDEEKEEAPIEESIESVSPTEEDTLTQENDHDENELPKTGVSDWFTEMRSKLGDFFYDLIKSIIRR